MGRTIKLLLYFFAYQLAFMGVAVCGYMLYQAVMRFHRHPTAYIQTLSCWHKSSPPRQ